MLLVCVCVRCSIEIERFILFASPRAVRAIPLEERDAYNVDALPPIVGRQRSRLRVNYVAVDFDARNKTVFFSDVRNRAIFFSKIGELGEFFYQPFIHVFT